MNFKKILILTGYDYSECFKALNGYSYSVVIPKNEPLLGEGAKTKLKSVLGGKCHELNYQEVEEFVLNEKPDFLITFGWRRIVSSEVIEVANYAINIHPAILPEYKGYHPVPHVLINNEKYHGITAHLINEDLDAGDIVHLEKFKISKHSTLVELQEKVNDIMPSFLNTLCLKIANGNFDLQENDNTKTKVVAGKRIPSDSKISLDTPIGKAYDYIRACDHERFPAYIEVEGRKIVIQLLIDNQLP